MDRFELVEKLVKSTGVSYEDAKTALESSGWDLLDAAVWLEKNGKVEAKSSRFSTNQEQQEQQEQSQQQRTYEAPRGSSASTGSGGRILHGIFTKIRNIVIDNELVISKQSGEIFLEIPIWLAVLLLIVAFWPTLIVLICVFFLGFRFHFHGPDLGGETVNRVLNHAENAAGKFVDKIKNQFMSSNTRNSSTNGSDTVIDYEDPNRKE